MRSKQHASNQAYGLLCFEKMLIFICSRYPVSLSPSKDDFNDIITFIAITPCFVGLGRAKNHRTGRIVVTPSAPRYTPEARTLATPKKATAFVKPGGEKLRLENLEVASAARARPLEARAPKDVSGVLNYAHGPEWKEKRCRGDPPDALRPTDTYLPPQTTT